MHTRGSYSLLRISLAHQTQNQCKMELMSIKLYFLLQCWQDVVIVKCAKLLYIYDYRLCASVGAVRILYLKVYDFLHTHRHFVGQ